MGEHTQASFDALTAPEQAGRFVLAGSMGRAAMLNDVDFKLQVGHADRDVDVVDRSALLKDSYEFCDAAPIDALLTRRLRPDANNQWGLYNPAGPEPDEPKVVIPDGLLRLDELAVPFVSAYMTTFDPCTQLALRNIHLADQGNNLKHYRQYQAVREVTHAEANFQCNCGDWQQVMQQYYNRSRDDQNYSLAEKVYLRTRWLAALAIPDVFIKMADNGILGDIVRFVNGAPTNKNHLDSIHNTKIFGPAV